MSNRPVNRIADEIRYLTSHSVGDDYCLPHRHGDRNSGKPECYRHHAYKDRGGNFRCPGCGRVTQSITTADAAKSLHDRLEQ